MKTSTVDKYITLIKADAKYLKMWIKLNGVEVSILKPRAEVVERYQTSFNADNSSFSLTQEFYSFHKGYLLIDSMDFGRLENITESDTLTYLPDKEIGVGDIIQFRRYGRLYSFTVTPRESFHEFIYRIGLELIGVHDEGL